MRWKSWKKFVLIKGKFLFILHSQYVAPFIRRPSAGMILAYLSGNNPVWETEGLMASLGEIFDSLRGGTMEWWNWPVKLELLYCLYSHNTYKGSLGRNYDIINPNLNFTSKIQHTLTDTDKVLDRLNLITVCYYF